MFTFLSKQKTKMNFIKFLLISSILCLENVFCWKFFDKVVKYTLCNAIECCNKIVIPYHIDKLASELEEKLFGQHIVQEQLFKAVYSHFQNIEVSKKPLVMSFHGTPGVGKNFVSEILASSLYKLGLNSKFVHVYHGTMDFTLKEAIEENRIKLAEEVLAEVKKCPYSLFIFDEVDKMLPGIFDSITALLDYHGTVRGVDIRKSIFIFIGNTGGREIAGTYEKMISNHRLYREETKLHHFEEIIKLLAFNVEGGLQYSQPITQSVIDHYMPFLPLERKHIEDCIRAEFRKNGVKYPVSQSVIDTIISRFVAFDRNKIFAVNGCKNLDKKVHVESIELLHEGYRIEQHSSEL